MGWTGGGTGGGGSPGGATGSVQYNNSGVFGGFGSWDNTNNTLTLSGATGTNPNLILNNVAGARINLQDGYASNYAIYTDTGGGIVLQASPTSGAAIRILNPSGFTPRIQVATLTDTTARINFGLDGSDNPNLAFGPGNASRDVFLWRDAASGILAQRNGANPQTLRIYNTTDSAIANYERGVIDWQAFANVFSIGTQYGGTGVARDLNFFSGSNNIKFFNGFGHTSHVYTTQHGWEIGYGGTQGNQPNIVFFSDNTIVLGGADAAAPTAQSLGVQNVAVGTVNGAGATWNLNGSLSTGAGDPGYIQLVTGYRGYPPGQTLTSISNAAPAVFTCPANHYLFGGVSVLLSTTGTLPAPLATLTPYYVDEASLTATTFEVSASFGGAPINTTSAGSGTHSFAIGGLVSGIFGGYYFSFSGQPGLINGMIIQFQCTGTMTGFSPGTNYYYRGGVIATTLQGAHLTGLSYTGTLTFTVQTSSQNLTSDKPFVIGPSAANGNFGQGGSNTFPAAFQVYQTWNTDTTSFQQVAGFYVQLNNLRFQSQPTCIAQFQTIGGSNEPLQISSLIGNHDWSINAGGNGENNAPQVRFGSDNWSTGFLYLQGNPLQLVGNLSGNPGSFIFGEFDAATAQIQTLSFQNQTGPNWGATAAPPAYIRAPLTSGPGAPGWIIFTGSYQGQVQPQTFTITLASPGVLTPANGTAGLQPEGPFLLTTTGALPTGLSTLTTYYLGNGATAFWAGDYDTGSYVNTSGSQSGVHTMSPGMVCTISNASPGVVTGIQTDGVHHGQHLICAGQPVVFQTTGTLPAPLVAGTTYYAVAANMDAYTFSVAATLNGAAINTTSAGSGTHTVLFQSGQNQAPFNAFPAGTNGGNLGIFIGPPILNANPISYGNANFQIDTQWAGAPSGVGCFRINITDVSADPNTGSPLFNINYQWPADHSHDTTFGVYTSGQWLFISQFPNLTLAYNSAAWASVQLYVDATTKPYLAFGGGSANVETVIQRDAAGIFGIRNSAPGAAGLRVYNSYGTTNFERGAFDWTTTSNVLTIGSQAGGTGTARNVALVAGSSTTTLTAGGGLQVGAPTGGDKGAGTINVAGNFYVNGTVVGGGGGAPGGSATQLQYNNSGAFGGVSGSSVSANGSLGLGGATVTANDPILNLSQTWNAAAVTFQGIKLNITNTASAHPSGGAQSMFADFQVGGTSKVQLIPTDLNGVANGTIAFGAPGSGGVSAIQASSGYVVVGRDDATVYSVALGWIAGTPNAGAVRVESGGGYGWSASNAVNAYDTFFGRMAAGVVGLSGGGSPSTATGLQVYNTTSAVSGAPTNYERGVFDWTTTSNVLTIGTQQGGSGSARYPQLVSAAGYVSVAGQLFANEIHGNNANSLAGSPDWVLKSLNSGLYINTTGGSGAALLGWKNGTILTWQTGSTTIIGWTSTSDPTSSNADTILSRQAAATLQHGAADAAAPVAQTVSYQSVVAGTTNTAGATTTEQLSLSSGTGAAGTKNITSGFAGVSGAATFTVTIATPAVFTLANHGYVPGQVLQFSTTGALPTGLSTATNYYVIATGLTASAFEVSATPGGAAVNTSGSQSGTHTSTPQTTAQNPASTVGTWGPSGLTGSQTTPALSVAQVWNTSGVATGFKLNVTNIASGAGSLLVDLQVGGLSAMHVDKAGSANYISGSIWSWSSSATNAATAGDTGLSRVAAKVVAFGDGAANANGWMQWAGLTRVTATVNFTSTTTLGTVTGLSANVQAGRTYKFVAELAFTCAAAGGIKAAIAGTCTATNIVYDGWVIDSAANGVKGNTQATALATTVASTLTTGTAGHLTIVGTITVNAAGTLLVQAAQNTSSTTATAILRGSTFVLYDIP